MKVSRGRTAIRRWAQRLLRERLRCYERARRAVCRELDDEEALHELRTQTRRLRVALEVLHPLVPLAHGAEKRMKRVIAATNARRDATVLAALVEQYRRESPAADPDELARIAAQAVPPLENPGATLHVLHAARGVRLQ